jgi:hypothetical protein
MAFFMLSSSPGTATSLHLRCKRILLLLTGLGTLCRGHAENDLIAFLNFPADFGIKPISRTCADTTRLQGIANLDPHHAKTTPPANFTATGSALHASLHSSACHPALSACIICIVCIVCIPCITSPAPHRPLFLD